MKTYYEDSISKPSQITFYEQGKQPIVIKEINEYKIEPIKKIEFFHGIKQLAKLSPDCYELIIGYDKEKNEKIVFLDEQYIIPSKPITIYLNYPFGNYINVEIYPCIRTYNNDMNSSKILNYVGCLVCQIAKVYSIIYNYYKEEANIWGHDIEDLNLHQINIYEHNIVTLEIGS